MSTAINSSRLLQTVVAHREHARKMRDDYALRPSLRPLTAAPGGVGGEHCAIGTHVNLSQPSLHSNASKNSRHLASSSAPPGSRTFSALGGGGLSEADIIAAGQDEEASCDEKIEEWQGEESLSVHGHGPHGSGGGGGARPSSAGGGRPPSPGLSRYAHIDDPKELRRLLHQLQSAVTVAEKKRSHAEARVKMLAQQVRTWKAHNAKRGGSGSGGGASPNGGEPTAAAGGDGAASDSGEEHVGARRSGSVASDALRELSDIASSDMTQEHEAAQQVEKEAAVVAAALGERWAQAFETAVEVRSVRDMRALLLEAIRRLKPSKTASGHHHTSSGSGRFGYTARSAEGTTAAGSPATSTIIPSAVTVPSTTIIKIHAMGPPVPALYVPKRREACITERHKQIDQLREQMEAVTAYGAGATSSLRTVHSACGKHAAALRAGLAVVVEALDGVKAMLSFTDAAKVLPTPTVVAKHIDEALGAVRSICGGVGHIAPFLAPEAPPPTAILTALHSKSLQQHRVSSALGSRGPTTAQAFYTLADLAAASQTERVVTDRLGEQEILLLYRAQRDDVVRLLTAVPVADAACQVSLGAAEDSDAFPRDSQDDSRNDDNAANVSEIEPRPKILSLLSLCISQMHTIYMNTLFGLERKPPSTSLSSPSAADTTAATVLPTGAVLSNSSAGGGQLNRSTASRGGGAPTAWADRAAGRAATRPHDAAAPAPSPSPAVVQFPIALSAEDDDELVMHVPEALQLLTIGLLWEAAMHPVRIVGCSSFLRLIKFAPAIARHHLTAAVLTLTVAAPSTRSGSFSKSRGLMELKDQAPSFTAALKSILQFDTSTLLRKDFADYRQKRELARAVVHQVSLLASTSAARAKFNWRGLLRLHKFVQARNLVVAATERVHESLAARKRPIAPPSTATAAAAGSATAIAVVGGSAAPTATNNSSTAAAAAAGMPASQNDFWTKLAGEVGRLATEYFADVAVEHHRDMALLKSTLRMSVDASFDHLLVLLREAQAENLATGINIDAVEALGPQAALVLEKACAQAKILAAAQKAELFSAPPLDALPPKPTLDASAFPSLAAAAALSTSTKSLPRLGSGVASSALSSSTSPAAAVLSVPTVPCHVQPARAASATPLSVSGSGGGSGGLRALHAKIAPDAPSLLACASVGAVLYDVRKLRLAHKDNPWLDK